MAERKDQFRRIKLCNMWEGFKEHIVLLTYVASKTVPMSKTSIHKLALFARKKGLFPSYFTRNLYKYGHFSQDIERGISELTREGVFSFKALEVPTHLSQRDSKRHMDLVEINPEAVKGMDIPLQYEEMIREIIFNRGSDVEELGDRTKKEFIKLLRDENTYHYASMCWISSEINRIKNKWVPYYLNDLSRLYKYLAKFAYEIIERKEEKEGYVFLIKHVKKAFENHHWLKVKGTRCLQVGHVSGIIKETEKRLYFYFANEAYHPWDKIKIILDKNGTFKADPANFKDHQYLLLGVIDEEAGEPVIKVAALVCIDDFPPDFPRFQGEGPEKDAEWA